MIIANKARTANGIQIGAKAQISGIFIMPHSLRTVSIIPNTAKISTIIIHRRFLDIFISKSI